MPGKPWLRRLVYPKDQKGLSLRVSKLSRAMEGLELGQATRARKSRLASARGASSRRRLEALFFSAHCSLWRGQIGQVEGVSATQDDETLILQVPVWYCEVPATQRLGEESRWLAVIIAVQEPRLPSLRTSAHCGASRAGLGGLSHCRPLPFPPHKGPFVMELVQCLGTRQI